MIYDHKATGTPMLLPATGGGSLLKRVSLGSGNKSEAWLQMLIFDQPEILPILTIEPAFHDPIAVACEVPCGHGYIDGLFVTPRGDIVLVEAKLWRNPQARRELVAQILDYVAALMTMTYTQFEAACSKGIPTRLTGSLWDLVRDHPYALDEASFIDTVARNLALGRVLALGVGDGIRSEAQALASLLQSHAGAHFTFALVELGFWENPVSGELLCIPNTTAQTVMIERGVVVFENGLGSVKSASTPTATSAKPHTITEAMFMETLAAISPGLPDAIHLFLEQAAVHGVYPDQKASLVLRADLGGAKPLNLGMISKDGRLWTDHVHTSVPYDLAVRYNEQLARLFGGKLPASGPPKVTTDGKSAPFVTALLPHQAEAWVAIIATLLRDVIDRSEEMV